MTVCEQPGRKPPCASALITIRGKSTLLTCECGKRFSSHSTLEASEAWMSHVITRGRRSRLGAPDLGEVLESIAKSA